MKTKTDETPTALSISEADPMPTAIALNINDGCSLVKMERVRACVSALAGLNPEALSEAVEAFGVLLLALATTKPGAGLLIAAQSRAEKALANLKGAQ